MSMRTRFYRSPHRIHDGQSNIEMTRITLGTVGSADIAAGAGNTA